MHASIGQYSIQAGEPAQPVQQSVVIARIRGRFLRAALPSPSDMGRCFSTMSNIRFVGEAFLPVYAVSLMRTDKNVCPTSIGVDSNIALLISSTTCASVLV